MPNIDLGTLQPEDIATLIREPPEKIRDFPAIRAAAVHVIAAMTYPEDEAARKQLLAVAALGRVAEIDQWQCSENPPDLGSWPENTQRQFQQARDANIGSAIRALVDPHGGLSAALAGPSLNEHEKRINEFVPNWLTVGRIVSLIHTMTLEENLKGGSGVLKAVDVLVKAGEQRGVKINRDKAMTLWTTHKSTRHLCAAFFVFGPFGDDWAKSPFGGQFSRLLAYARAFQVFLVEHRSRGRNAGLNTREELLTIPDWPTLPAASLPTAPLNTDERQALEGYSVKLRA